jgi:predicted HTH domain antitoxin
MAQEAVVKVPEGVPQLLKMSDSEFAKELPFLAAAKLYELGRLSSGKAAQLAGMERVEFLYALARVGVPAINLRDEQIDREIAAAKRLSAMPTSNSETEA